jgi:RNA polymerase sigma factor (sigma-70 family)
MENVTISFFAANPASSSRLALDAEVRDIERKIQLSSCRIPIRLRTHWAVQPDDLLQALNQDRPTVVHFSGHGTGDEGIVMHGIDGDAASVGAPALARLFRTMKDDIRVVVLNACYSEAQARPIAKIIDCVVGMKSSIGDVAARAFSAAFYGALGHGKSVSNAFDQGCAAIHLLNLRDEDTPELLVRDGVMATNIYLGGHDVAFASGDRFKCTITIKARFSEFDADLVKRITEELRGRSGDVTLEITAIKEGSVRLTITASAVGRSNLLKLHKHGKLTQILGFEVVDVQRDTSTLASQLANPSAAQAASPAAFHREGTQRLALALRTDDPRSPLQPPPTVPPLQEDQLQLSIRRQDWRRVLEILMQEHGSSIFNFLRVTLQDHALAEDLLQSIFVEVYTALPQLKEIPSWRAWLYRVARHRALDAMRARRRWRFRVDVDSPVTPDSAEPASHEGRLEQAELRHGLDECLRALPPATRIALLLRYEEGLTYDEIARIATERPAVVQARVARALPLLRACLQKKGISL